MNNKLIEMQEMLMRQMKRLDDDKLMAVPIKVALRTAGQDMFYKDKELTKTALKISAVRLKIMEVENG